MPDTTRHPAAGPMSDGSHLSIGEVLALLLEEFPDVTISKIRFLESQGLIDPERTPSGYRKFFDADVELLRVILREQRENYLPLRVIKDRIHSGELDPSGEHPVPPPAGIRNVEAGIAAFADLGDADSGAGADLDPSGEVDEEPDSGDGLGDTPPEPQAEVHVQAHDNHHADAAPDQPAIDDSATDRDLGEVGEPDVEQADALAAAVRAAGERAPQSPPARPPSKVAPSPQLLPGVTLSVDELAAMVGATREEVAQLEEYGIIAGRNSLGERIYDEDAVEITKVAVEFLRAGVDARHLRGWKTSVDRETSVYEQLILPLLRQRNPEGRQAARDQLHRMSELGGKLRGALIRASLRNHLGG